MSLRHSLYLAALIGPMVVGSGVGCADSSGSPESGTDTEGGTGGTEGDEGTTNPSTTASASGSETASSGATTDDATESTSESATETGETNTTGEGSTSAGETSGGATTTGGMLEPGCPDNLPGDWILCEDFEVVGDPSTYFGNFWTNDNLMRVEETDAFSGARALTIGHDPSTFASGMADIRFGQGPGGGTVHAPDQSYREVWVRFLLRTEDAWPDAGIAEAVEVMSVFGNARAIAVDATIYSPSQAEAQALAWSCVHNSQLMCNGQGDWGNPSLEVREGGLGTSPLYGSQAAGQWQCHEIHVRLDDPGQANGMFEVFVDGQEEVSLQGIEYVDAWDGAEINNVRFSSFWNAPAQLVHHVDDVVVSTAPIGCG